MLDKLLELGRYYFGADAWVLRIFGLVSTAVVSIPEAPGFRWLESFLFEGILSVVAVRLGDCLKGEVKGEEKKSVKFCKAI